MASKSRPIRIFFSPLSRRFYASSAYKEESEGIVIITGHSYDVTNQIAELIETHSVTFTRAKDQADWPVQRTKKAVQS